MAELTKPVFVRLPASEADKLTEIATTTGRSKRQIVSEAVRNHLAADGLLLGRVALRELPAEVMTLGEAADFLRVTERALAESARRGELPGRKLGDEWRFSRDALMMWLSRSDEPLDRTR